MFRKAVLPTTVYTDIDFKREETNSMLNLAKMYKNNNQNHLPTAADLLAKKFPQIIQKQPQISPPPSGMNISNFKPPEP
jgi:hypothetical protein